MQNAATHFYATFTGKLKSGLIEVGYSKIALVPGLDGENVIVDQVETLSEALQLCKKIRASNYTMDGERITVKAFQRRNAA